MSSSRRPISHSQRRALRRYFQTTSPSPTQAALRSWFKDQFGHEISQSIVSRTLSDSFAHLDVHFHSVSDYRSRSCQWPWLETLLTDWLEEAESGGRTVSNDAITRKAMQLWHQSEQAQGHTMPTFSAGWTVKFRRRHQVRLQTLPDRQRIRTIAKRSSDENISSLSSAKLMEILDQASTSLPTLINSSTARGPSSNPHLTTSVRLSSDHLLCLIQYNAFRAFVSNKNLVSEATIRLDESDSKFSIQQFQSEKCGDKKVVRPLVNRKLPDTLYPTELQMNCGHTDLITMFPFPKFRDNLIRQGVGFVLEEMCKDLVGDIFPDYFNSSSVADSNLLNDPEDACVAGTRSANIVEDEDDYTAGRRCLIVWGDPWSIENWEVTPMFAKRWSWALKGCDDLIRSSNRWRAFRNEEPIRWPLSM